MRFNLFSGACGAASGGPGWPRMDAAGARRRHGSHGIYGKPGYHPSPPPCAKGTTPSRNRRTGPEVAASDCLGSCLMGGLPNGVPPHFAGGINYPARRGRPPLRTAIRGPPLLHPPAHRLPLANTFSTGPVAHCGNTLRHGHANPFTFNPSPWPGAQRPISRARPCCR